MRHWILVLCVSALGASTARAQTETPPATETPAPAPVGGFTLEEALAAMRRAHPLVAAATAAIDAARGDVVDAGLWTNPVVSGTWNPGIVQSSYDPSGYVNWTVSQFIEAADTPGARARAAQLLRAASEADLNAVIVDLSLDVEGAFVTASEAHERARVLTTTIAALRAASQVVDQRAAAGSAPRYDSARMLIAVTIMQADLATANADVVLANAAVRSAIGPGSDSLMGEPQFALFEAPPLPSLDDLLTRLRGTRPDLVALEQRAQAAEATIAVTRRMVFPGFAVQLGGGFGASPGQVDLMLGLMIPIPIIDFGQGSIPASEARAVVSHAFRQSVLTPAELLLAGARLADSDRRDAVTAYRGTAQTNDVEVLAEAQAGYAAARFSILELADAYFAVRDSQLRGITLAMTARQADVDLGRLVGGSIRTQTSSSTTSDRRTP